MQLSSQAATSRGRSDGSLGKLPSRLEGPTPRCSSGRLQFHNPGIQVPGLEASAAWDSAWCFGW
jgi:hypothetical protein